MSGAKPAMYNVERTLKLVAERAENLKPTRRRQPETCTCQASRGDDVYPALFQKWECAPYPAHILVGIPRFQCA